MPVCPSLSFAHTRSLSLPPPSFRFIDLYLLQLPERRIKNKALGDLHLKRHNIRQPCMDAASENKALSDLHMKRHNMCQPCMDAASGTKALGDLHLKMHNIRQPCVDAASRRKREEGWHFVKRRHTTHAFIYDSPLSYPRGRGPSPRPSILQFFETKSKMYGGKYAARLVCAKFLSK